MPAMNLEDRIRRLTEDIIACRDEAEAVILTRDLGITLHEHIKRLGGNSPSPVQTGSSPWLGRSQVSG